MRSDISTSDHTPPACSTFCSKPARRSEQSARRQICDSLNSLNNRVWADLVALYCLHAELPVSGRRSECRSFGWSRARSPLLPAPHVLREHCIWRLTLGPPQPFLQGPQQPSRSQRHRPTRDPANQPGVQSQICSRALQHASPCAGRGFPGRAAPWVSGGATHQAVLAVCGCADCAWLRARPLSTLPRSAAVQAGRVPGVAFFSQSYPGKQAPVWGCTEIP